MKKYLVLATIAGAAMFCASPAMATHDDLNWSITIGSPGYPPPVAYGPPRVVYERVQPVVVERRAIVRYGHGYREGHGRGHYRDQHRHGRHEWHERRHHHRHDHYRYNY